MSVSKLKIKSEFLKNILSFITGTTFAQALTVLVSPILSRLYSPEDFALLALYVSISGIISVMATARYELAILLPKKNADANNIIAICLGITIALCIITFLFFYYLIIKLQYY